MGQIQKSSTDKSPLNKNALMSMPVMQVPSFRVLHAIENGVQNNLLVRAFGGIGDQLCAEPAIRYALKHFKNCDISVESYTPALFQHLPLKGNFHEKDLTAEQRDTYYSFKSMYSPDDLNWEFLCHPIIHCVDFASLNLWRSTLPTQDKNIVLVPTSQETEVAEREINPATDIVIHPGKTWQSRTVPDFFWDEVIEYILSKGARPVLIGAEILGGKGGTVNVQTPHGILDLRGRLSLMETTAVLQKARVFLTNDSAPLHIAASGQAWIGLISTVRHPDYITHWRKTETGKVEYGWRQENHSLGGMWERLNFCPNNTQEMFFDKIDLPTLCSWLPDASTYSEWALEKLNGVY